MILGEWVNIVIWILWCFFFILFWLVVEVFWGYFFLESCRNFGFCFYLLVSFCVGILWEILLVIFNFLGMCFYCEGLELFWIFVIWVDINGLNFFVLLWIYDRMILLFEKNMIFLNCSCDFFVMDWYSLVVSIVVCSFRWGMVSGFSGVIFDLVVMNFVLYLLFLVCYLM